MYQIIIASRILIFLHLTSCYTEQNSVYTVIFYVFLGKRGRFYLSIHAHEYPKNQADYKAIVREPNQSVFLETEYNAVSIFFPFNLCWPTDFMLNPFNGISSLTIEEVIKKPCCLVSSFLWEVFI